MSSQTYFFLLSSSINCCFLINHAYLLPTSFLFSHTYIFFIVLFRRTLITYIHSCNKVVLIVLLHISNFFFPYFRALRDFILCRALPFLDIIIAPTSPLPSSTIHNYYVFSKMITKFHFP